MTARYVALDRALPVSESVLAGADPHGLPLADLLAVALVTDLEATGHQDAADMVRAAMALGPPGIFATVRARASHETRLSA